MKEWAKQTLTNEDCMELLARTPDKFYDLAIVDPPYGIGGNKRGMTNYNVGKVSKNNWTVKASKWKEGNWDNSAPSDLYFNEVFRVSKKAIIWGANNFVLPASNGWIVWDKGVAEKFSMSKCELAYTNFLRHIDKFQYNWFGFVQGENGNSREPRIHPTQKPVALYKWLLSNYAKEGDKILDTHLGSGSIAIACLDMGFELTGCELDADYFVKMQERINIHKAQAQLF